MHSRPTPIHIYRSQVFEDEAASKAVHNMRVTAKQGMLQGVCFRQLDRLIRKRTETGFEDSKGVQK